MCVSAHAALGLVRPSDPSPALEAFKFHSESGWHFLMLHQLARVGGGRIRSPASPVRGGAATTGGVVTATPDIGLGLDDGGLERRRSLVSSRSVSGQTVRAARRRP